MKKGLRPLDPRECLIPFASENSPDEEGIKTHAGGCASGSMLLRRTALMKKGLRLEQVADVVEEGIFGEQP